MDVSALDGTAEDDEKYTRKIETPIYEPTQETPPAFEQMVDTEKRDALLDAIERANVSEDEKRFLRRAAERHTVFDYSQIAEYYAHAEPEMQRLMENSALVIIDFEKAIEQGFVKLTDRMATLYEESAPDDEE
jgi:hypothetical protein